MVLAAVNFVAAFGRPPANKIFVAHLTNTAANLDVWNSWQALCNIPRCPFLDFLARPSQKTSKILAAL